MGILEYIEYGLSWLFINFKGRDAKLFTKGPAFTDFPSPTIELTSPDCGPSGSSLKPEYTQLGTERFPELKWPAPSSSSSAEVKEYILLCEDADVPFPAPVYHSLFYSIPAHATGVTASDVELVQGGEGKEKVLRGGFKFVKNLMGKHYVGPKPLLGHGPHRYFYELVALREPVDVDGLGGKVTKDRLASAIVGKVVGWGVWVGAFERKWE